MSEGPPLGTVLVVDDDDATSQLVATFLRRNRYRVLVASNPIRALELAKAEPVDVVLTDLMMPYIDGVAFTEQLHATAGYEHLPVILITAYADEDLVEASMRRGVAMTLAKPLQLQKLLDLVGFATARPPAADSR